MLCILDTSLEIDLPVAGCMHFMKKMEVLTNRDLELKYSIDSDNMVSALVEDMLG